MRIGQIAFTCRKPFTDLLFEKSVVKGGESSCACQLRRQTRYSSRLERQTRNTQPVKVFSFAQRVYNKSADIYLGQELLGHLMSTPQCNIITVFTEGENIYGYETRSEN